MKSSRRILTLLLVLLAHAGGSGADHVLAASCDPAAESAALTGSERDPRTAFRAGAAPVLEAVASPSGAPVRLAPKSSRGGGSGPVSTHAVAPKASRARAARLAALRFSAALAAAAENRRATWSTAPPPPVDA